MYSDISDALKREMYSEFSESLKGKGGSRPERKTCQNLSFWEYRT